MTATLVFGGSLESWRLEARSAIARGLSPESVFWATDAGDGGLFADAAPPAAMSAGSATIELRVPRPFLALAASVSCHRDENRWSALYAVLWRLVHGEPHLLSVASDPAVHRLIQLHRAVKRAAHKMKAFVRFRRVMIQADDPDYVAWFEPAHLVVDRVAPFFARRFPSMRWSILTPERSVHWDRTALTFAAGVPRAAAPGGDELEELWRTYYANIFNPARLNTRAMRAEMPQRYWVGLPEAEVIATLTSGATQRVSRMLEQTFATPEALPPDCVPTKQDIADAQQVAAGWDPVYDPGGAEAQRRERAAKFSGVAQTVVNGNTVSLGVAGWTDPSLLVPGLFYPRGCTTPEQRLRYYASRFSMVEVDATYYTPPTRAMAAAWASRTPDEFRFDIKAHALMTGHPTDARRLPEWIRRELPRSANGDARIYSSDLPPAVLDEVWTRFRSALDPLRSANKLGAIMLQFPRWFRPTRESANALIRARELLGDDLVTVELRQRTWMEGRVAERTLSLLRELQFSYVIVDAPPGMESSMPPTVAVTDARLAVFRLHGRRVSTWEAKNDPVTERYRYLYDQAQLRHWIPAVREIAHQVAAVHLTFNNNHANYATTNALEMAQLLVE
jgi:probable DNA metabolism protein